MYPKGFSNFILNCTCRFFSERGTFLQLPIKEIVFSNARTFSRAWNILFNCGNLWIFFECLMIVEQDGYERNMETRESRVIWLWISKKGTVLLTILSIVTYLARIVFWAGLTSLCCRITLLRFQGWGSILSQMSSLISLGKFYTFDFL